LEISKNDREDTYRQAVKLFGSGDVDLAYVKFAGLLNENFDDAKALYGLGRIYREAEHYGLAFNLFRVCAGFRKMGAGPWNEMGLCQAETYDLDVALNCFRRALQIDPNDTHALGNLSLVHLLKCEPEKALRFGRMALEARPDFESVHHHMAYANLLLGNWREGWEGHKRILGKVKTRTERFYENKGKMLPKWDGEHGKTVLVYGEQGIGDEISFASCIPDLVKVSTKVIFDCDHRLETLFRKSFPEVAIHGTRFKDPTQWIDDYDIDSRVAIGDLPSFFRNADEDFPGTPYLKAEPLKLDRPTIGIAWTGGKPNTGSVKRSLELEMMLPILKSVNARWVSLEYKDRSEEINAFAEKHGIEIETRPEASSKDYSYTASLVDGMDLVISATTAVVHLSGALGKECWCLVPSTPRWFYSMNTDISPWYKSVKFFRQKRGWDEPIEQISRVLKVRYAGGL
jgi:hypothetical protein